MIEEAAGTRMFEDRRDKAFKTMAKKDKKVEEINELLREEIEPKLEKLRTEKRAFLDFQQTQSDLERLIKLVVAHDYIKNQEKANRSADYLQAKRQRMKEIDQSAKRTKLEIENLGEDIQRLKAQRDKELRKGGRFQALEDEVKDKSHEAVRLTTVLDLKSANVAEEKKKQEAQQKTVGELEKALEEKTRVYRDLKEAHDFAKAQFNRLSKQAESSDELLQTLLTGVASKEGQENGYQNQLQSARNDATAAMTEQEQTKLRISHLEKQIREQEPKAKKAKEQNASLFKDLEALKASTKVLEIELDKLGYKDGKREEVRQQEAHLEESIHNLRERADELRRRVSNIDFNYSDPTPNFDRSKVKGLVAQLFTLEQDKFVAGTALEICAGGRLYNVVVDTTETSTLLLQNGRLRKRVTIIPLNKINFFRASAEKIATAHQLAPNKVDLALTLIGYSEQVSAAMDYVFGSTFICADADAAKCVTFDPSVRLRSVTLNGDVYDPSGTLSGGSAPNTSGVLVTMQKLNDLTRQIREEMTKLSVLRELMAREQKRLDATRRLKQDLELKRHEISLTEKQINSNSSSSIISKVAGMKENILQLKNEIVEAKKRQADATKNAKQIERDMKDFSDNKDGKLAELQKTLGDMKKEVVKHSQAMKAAQKEFQNAQLEKEHTSTDLSAAQEQLEETRATILSQEEEIVNLRLEQARLKDIHDIALAQLEDERTKLSSFDEELALLDSAIASKKARLAEESLEKQKVGHDFERFHKEQASALEIVAQMEREYEWILEEKEHFGKAGTPYDFTPINITECRTSLKNATERFGTMKKKINPKVMNMIDSVEKKEIALKNMLRTVIKDKRKIEDTVIELDRYKLEALEKTHGKVSGDFGAIFRELLPGSFARLDPIEGKKVSEGLEVKVQLGKVWKQSLTELSGGQRSLIALSLIMALLQFKPAPMYILDEVDAALDLSHTQNIGRLIKTRFKGSQFIVVSLKDGMFQNANRYEYLTFIFHGA